MRKRLLSGVVALLLLSGCALEPAGTTQETPTPSITAGTETQVIAVPGENRPPDLDALLDSVNQRRQQIQMDEETAEILFQQAGCEDFTDELDLLSEEEISALATKTNGAEELTPEQIRADIDLFFRLLKSTYGAYNYFGGDEVFLPLKEQALNAVDGFGNYPQLGLRVTLVKLLAPILQDGHFSIDGQCVLEQKYMYFVPDLYFDDPSGIDSDLYQLTVGPDGKITYWLAVQSVNGTELPESLMVEGMERSLCWKRADQTVYRGYSVFACSEQDGIPLFRCMKLKGAETQLNKMAETGVKYADEPLMMIDLRGNQGGSDGYAMRWMEGYLGGPAERALAAAQKCSPAYVAVQRRMGNEDWARWLEQDLGKWVPYASAGTWNPRDGLTLALMDSSVASSGESFLEMLGTVENVLFLGAPSSGCSLCGNCATYYLPNSGLSVYFGSKLFWVGDGTNRDGVGIQPDLWVDPAEAAEAAVRLCGYYQAIEQ